jgi:hypothetical protein
MACSQSCSTRFTRLPQGCKTQRVLRSASARMLHEACAAVLNGLFAYRQCEAVAQSALLI